MSIAAIAWRNLWRHKRRSLITAGAMSMGVGFCMAIMAYTTGMYAQMNRLMVDEMTGHVQVHHPAYPGSRKLHDTIPEELLQRSKTAEGVRAASARLFGAALVASENSTTGAQIIGVVPTDEAGLTAVSRTMRTGAYLGPEAGHEVIVGVELADKLGLELGDELVIVTQAADGSMGNDLFKVAGPHDSLDVGDQLRHVLPAHFIVRRCDQVAENPQAFREVGCGFNAMQQHRLGTRRAPRGWQLGPRATRSSVGTATLPDSSLSWCRSTTCPSRDADSRRSRVERQLAGASGRGW